MGKPHIHAGSSVKHFGGSPQDYLKIHQFIDQSATTFGDLRHRALTHTQWFLREILPLKFGDTIKNSDGRLVSVVEIGEQHVLEDYGGKFIPAVADFLQEMELTA